MPDCNLTCRYCDHRWSVWLSPNSQLPECVICGHKDIKIKEKDPAQNNVFGYDLDEPLIDAYFNIRKRK